MRRWSCLSQPLDVHTYDLLTSPSTLGTPGPCPCCLRAILRGEGYRPTMSRSSSTAPRLWRTVIAQVFAPGANTTNASFTPTRGQPLPAQDLGPGLRRRNIRKSNRCVKRWSRIFQVRTKRTAHKRYQALLQRLQDTILDVIVRYDQPTVLQRICRSGRPVRGAPGGDLYLVRSGPAAGSCVVSSNTSKQFSWALLFRGIMDAPGTQCLHRPRQGNVCQPHGACLQLGGDTRPGTAGACFGQQNEWPNSVGSAAHCALTRARERSLCCDSSQDPHRSKRGTHRPRTPAWAGEHGVDRSGRRDQRRGGHRQAD